MPRLEALRLFTRPNFPKDSDTACSADDSGLVEGPVGLNVSEQMQGLADKVFARLYQCCPNLLAVVLDARQDEQDCTYDEEVLRFGYIRELKTCACGHSTSVAISTGRQTIKQHVDSARILDSRSWVGLP